MQPWAFYQTHLNGVSRSFAFCIAQLPQPQRTQVGLAYLLFRVIDTIEDSAWPTVDDQRAQFDCFSQWLNDLPPVSSRVDWQSSFPQTITVAEGALLKDIWPLLTDFHQLPITMQMAFRQGLNTMSLGMQYFLTHHTKHSGLFLSKLAEVNQYCFFVAGIVGELLSHIFAEVMLERSDPRRRLLDGFHFGLFLQKVNILKDYQQDLHQGRALVPSRRELRASLIKHAKPALSYIKSIDAVCGRSYRIFCGWSLFIGLASLKWIDRSYEQQRPGKIPYAETVSVMFDVRQRVDSDEKLDELLLKYLPEALVDDSPPASEVDLPDWFKAIYHNALFSSAGAVELGLLC